MPPRSRLAALVAAALALVASEASAGCTIRGVATLKVTMDGTRPMVPAKINGVGALFIADSGSFFSMLSPASVSRFQLKEREEGGKGAIMGVGGEVPVGSAEVKAFALAGATIPNVSFLVGGSDVGGEAVGVLGQNMLGFTDMEYDLANGVIRLMRPDGCGYQPLAYWATSQPFSAVDIGSSDVKTAETSNGASRIVQGNAGEFRSAQAFATVNGARIRVLFDTGASVSIMTLDAAKRAGVDIHGPGAAGGGGVSGFGQKAVVTWIAPVASFKIGDEEIRNTKLRVADLGLDDVDMLLGADFFLAHRVYIANSQHRLYFTYNGGPVFDLAVRNTGAVGAEAPAAPRSGDAQPTDAAGFGRRGAAFAARDDYSRAIADFDRASQLDPGDGQYAYLRGMAHLGRNELALAMADFDRSLALEPGNVRARLERAKLDLSRRDTVKGLADIGAAAGDAPEQDDLRLDMAQLYLSGDAFAAAIGQFDLWLSNHPNDVQVAAALEGRCRARALWNRELDKALADCNAALKLAPKTAQILDSRGLVRLRQGDAASAVGDYDSALRLEPKTATSLYGRGIAELKKGLAAQGKADIAAAVAIDPTVPDNAKRHGLTP